jgi:hypothetical protein
MRCVRKIEQKGGTGIGDKTDAAAVPVEISEGHSINEAIIRPSAAGMDSDRPAHVSAQ